jgi:predicted enzyme related to lactoylglutathione lyase
MSKHPIVHIEIPAQDPAQAVKFYNALFDWKMEVNDQFNYHMFDPGDGPGGAFVNVGMDPSGSNEMKINEPLIYVGTDDIPQTLNRAVELGGKLFYPETEIPGQGWFAIFQDISGNKVALYKSLNPQG